MDQILITDGRSSARGHSHDEKRKATSLNVYGERTSRTSAACDIGGGSSVSQGVQISAYNTSGMCDGAEYILSWFDAFNGYHENGGTAQFYLPRMRDTTVAAPTVAGRGSR